MSDIENPWLLHNLTEQMRELGVSQYEIDRFAEVWSKLTSHTPYPCPYCFTQGDEGELYALNERDGLEPVKCRNCKTIYSIPTPTA